MKNEAKKNEVKKSESKKKVVKASIELSKYFDKEGYHEYFTKTELQKNGSLLLELGRFFNDKLLLSRSVSVTPTHVKQLQALCKEKNQKKRRNGLLDISWNYVTIDKLATDSESVKLGLFKKARNRDIVCTMLNNIPNCSAKMY